MLMGHTYKDIKRVYSDNNTKPEWRKYKRQYCKSDNKDEWYDVDSEFN